MIPSEILAGFGSTPYLAPPRRFVALLPVVFSIPKAPLDFLYNALIARVLAQVVTEFDGSATFCIGNFDDDIEGKRFLAVGFANEVICSACFSIEL
jgi:hypothetical protein